MEKRRGGGRARWCGDWLTCSVATVLFYCFFPLPNALFSLLVGPKFIDSRGNLSQSFRKMSVTIFFTFCVLLWNLWEIFFRWEHEHQTSKKQETIRRIRKERKNSRNHAWERKKRRRGVWKTANFAKKMENRRFLVKTHQSSWEKSWRKCCISRKM